MSQIIDFYTEEGTDSEGRTLEEMLLWRDSTLEWSHDSIQWLFPLREPSSFNPDAPLLTDEDIALWQANKHLQDNLHRAFERFLRFLGLRWEEGRVHPADNFALRAPVIWNRFNHNFLRVTRCLASLRLLGLAAEAEAFYRHLESMYDSGHFAISDHTFQFWTEAWAGSPFTGGIGA
jgi:hypothetical protein